MGILDRALTLEFSEFDKICDLADQVNHEWYNEWINED